MRKKSFNNYLDRVGDLTVTQRETLLERLTKQTSQETVHYEIEKRIENGQECPHSQSKHMQCWEVPTIFSGFAAVVAKKHSPV